MRISDWSSDVCSSDLGVDVVTLADSDVHVLDPRRSAPGRDLTVAGNAGSRPGALLRALRKDELEPRQVRRRGDLEIVVRSLDQQRAVALALHGHRFVGDFAAGVARRLDRKSVGWGKRASVRVDLGGSRFIKTKKNE